MGERRYTAYPMASVITRGRRVFLGRFATRQERDDAVRKFREKYPDHRRKIVR